MKSLQTVTGIAALLCLASAVNLLVWQQESLMGLAWGGLLLGLGLGLVWLVLAIVSLAGSAGWEGWAAGGVNAALSTLFFLGICITVYVLTARSHASWDLTQEGRRDLAPQTVQVLQTMNQEVEVMCLFLSVDDELVMIAREKTQRFLEQCQGYTGLLKVEEMDPQVEMPRLQAMGVTHVSTQGTIVVKAGKRQRVITLAGGSPRLEERDFTNALINVLREKEPQIGFLTGHQERSLADEDPQKGGSVMGNLLTGEAYGIGNVSIKISDPEIPQGISVLVINNPRGDLHPMEIKAIDAYLEKGGRLLMLLEPWKSVTQGLGQGEQMRPWLEERFGIAVGSDMLMCQGRKKPWELELRNDDKPFADTDAGFMEYTGSFLKGHPITGGFDRALLMDDVRSVGKAAKVPEGVSVQEIIRSTPEYWGETNLQLLEEKREATKGTEEKGGPLPIAVAAVRKTGAVDDTGQPVTSRVVVIGDSDFATNGQLITETQGSLNLLMNTMAWLTEREDLIAIRPSGKTDPPIMLNQGEQRAIVWVSTLLTAQLVAAAGLAAFLLRRKYR